MELRGEGQLGETRGMFSTIFTLADDLSDGKYASPLSAMHVAIVKSYHQSRTTHLFPRFFIPSTSDQCREAVPTSWPFKEIKVVRPDALTSKTQQPGRVNSGVWSGDDSARPAGNIRDKCGLTALCFWTRRRYRTTERRKGKGSGVGSVLDDHPAAS